MGRGRIPPEKVDRIHRLIVAGYSDYSIAQIVGVDSRSVSRRRPQRTSKPHISPSDPNCCDWCGDPIKNLSEYKKPSRQGQKHKFCSRQCFCDYYHHLRTNDRCVRCGRQRYTKIGDHQWSRGMCGRCYGVMQQFGFDEAAAAAYDLTQVLKRELNNV